MKRTVTTISFILLLGGLFWISDKQEEAFMKDLLLHQPIAYEAIEEAKMVEASNNMEIDIQEDELRKIIKAFNNYPASKVTEVPPLIDETDTSPYVKGSIQIKLAGNQEVGIFLTTNKNNIYVKRTDIKEGMAIRYSLIADSTELRELINWFTFE